MGKWDMGGIWMGKKRGKQNGQEDLELELGVAQKVADVLAVDLEVRDAHKEPGVSPQKQSHFVSPSAFEMWPKMWAKEFGIMPRSSGTARTPSMVKVLPVPVCPYAKMVPSDQNPAMYSTIVSFKNGVDDGPSCLVVHIGLDGFVVKNVIEKEVFSLFSIFRVADSNHAPCL